MPGTVQYQGCHICKASDHIAANCPMKKPKTEPVEKKVRPNPTEAGKEAVESRAPRVVAEGGAEAHDPPPSRRSEAAGEEVTPPREAASDERERSKEEVNPRSMSMPPGLGWGSVSGPEAAPHPTTEGEGKEGGELGTSRHAPRLESRPNVMELTDEVDDVASTASRVEGQLAEEHTALQQGAVSGEEAMVGCQREAERERAEGACAEASRNDM